MAFGYDLTQQELDALAGQQALADAAATAPVPPPYDPAQDTQGMQAQPESIAPAPYSVSGPGPEYEIQTIVPPPDQGYAVQTATPTGGYHTGGLNDQQAYPDQHVGLETTYPPVRLPVPSTVYGGPASLADIGLSPQANPRAVESMYPSAGAEPTVRTIPPLGSNYPAVEEPREVYGRFPPPPVDRSETVERMGELLWLMDQRRQRQTLRGLFGGQADPGPAPRPPIEIERPPRSIPPRPWWLRRSP
jgi:hypothetical protein